MNRRMNLPALTEIMAKFQMESAAMESTQEIMGDAVDSALAGEDEVSATSCKVLFVLRPIPFCATTPSRLAGRGGGRGREAGLRGAEAGYG